MCKSSEREGNNYFFHQLILFAENQKIELRRKAKIKISVHSAPWQIRNQTTFYNSLLISGNEFS
jgi:hypothetical protein